MNSFDKAVAFQNIVKYLKRSDIKYLQRKLELQDKDIERFHGLDVEARFYLLLFFKHRIIDFILPFDEKPSKLLMSASPDALIKLKKQTPFLLEIKSTKATEKKISVKRIKSQISFAKKLGFPLMYAYYINNAWGLFEAKFVLAKSGVIKYEDFINHSMFEQLMQIAFVTVRKGTMIHIISSKKKRNTIGIKSSYGGIQDIVIQTKNSRLSLPPDKLLSRFAMSLTYFPKYIERVKTVTDENTTAITITYVQDMVIPDYEIIMTLVRYTMNNLNKRLYSATDFFHFLLENNVTSEGLLDVVNLVYEPVKILKREGIGVELMKYRSFR